MKILQVISSFPPAYSYGGPAKVAYDLSKELVKRNHDVTVYTTDVYDANSRFVFDKNPMYMDGIKVYHFKNLSNELAHKNYSISPMMFFELSQRVKEFDIIHLHEYRSFQAAFVLYFAKKYNIPYILQAHGSVLPLFSKSGLKKCFDLVCGYDILKNASLIIALTKKEAEQYEKMGADQTKIQIMPNGINFAEYQNLPSKGLFKEKYGIKNNEKVVLYLGRINWIKGIDLLVEAFSELVSRIEGVKLVIAGPDDGFLSILKMKTENLELNNRVLFTGPLYGAHKLEAYVDADVYVLPSVYETFPMTVLEAYACGTPVVVTDRCGISDMVEKFGLVVEYDKKQLADAVFEILNDEKLRITFGEEGRKQVQEQFIWDKIVENLEKNYFVVHSKIGDIY